MMTYALWILAFLLALTGAGLAMGALQFAALTSVIPGIVGLFVLIAGCVLAGYAVSECFPMTGTVGAFA